MGDFAQNGFVTTLHNFGTKSVQQFEEELKTFSGYPADGAYSAQFIFRA